MIKLIFGVVFRLVAFIIPIVLCSMSAHATRGTVKGATCDEDKNKSN